MTFKKTVISVSADADLILDLKRTLFKHGLSVDAFFHYIIAKASIRDEQVLALMEDAIAANKNKEDSIFKLVNNSKKKEKIDSEMIYDLIESELRANNSSIEEEQQQKGELR